MTLADLVSSAQELAGVDKVWVENPAPSYSQEQEGQASSCPKIRWVGFNPL